MTHTDEVPVEQVDRDAAGDLCDLKADYAVSGAIRRGENDGGPSVQAFARHRLSSGSDVVTVPSGWRFDMDAAPRDGSPILTHGRDEGTAIASWETHHGRSGWAIGNDDTAPEDCYTIWAEPTAWMHLPAAPTPTGGKA